MRLQLQYRSLQHLHNMPLNVDSGTILKVTILTLPAPFVRYISAISWTQIARFVWKCIRLIFCIWCSSLALMTCVFNPCVSNSNTFYPFSGITPYTWSFPLRYGFSAFSKVNFNSNSRPGFQQGVGVAQRNDLKANGFPSCTDFILWSRRYWNNDNESQISLFTVAKRGNFVKYGTYQGVAITFKRTVKVSTHKVSFRFSESIWFIVDLTILDEAQHVPQLSNFRATQAKPYNSGMPLP